MTKFNEDFINKKLKLINQNLQETIGEDVIRSCLQEKGMINLYWGTAPTGRPHIAYFLPMIKIADFLKSECNVTILFADLHAYLDNMKAPWELLQKRTEYYEVLIKGMLRALKVPLNKLRFIRGTEYQLDDNYARVVYQIIGLTSMRDAAKAGCEVVKQVSDPLLSGIVYPLLQAIDEEFLGVDVQFGGVDQRKIFMYAEKYLSSLNMAKRAHLMNPMVPGLTGGKMSASEEASKIDLLDSKETMLRKLEGANCEGKTVDTNGILAFIKHIALPLKCHFDHVLLNNYNSIEEIENDYSNGTLSEKDLKEIIGLILGSLMSTLREEFVIMDKEKLIEEAYPTVIEDRNVEVEEDTKKRSLSFEEFESIKVEFSQLSDISINRFPEIINRPSIMWSCRASGEPHIGYLLPLRKLAALSNGNWDVIILIEDIGAYLHSKFNLNKPGFDLLKERGELYYEFCKSSFKLFGGNLNNLKLILGSEFQLSKTYTMMMYQSLSKVTESESSRVLEQMVGNVPEITSNLSSVIYPCISVLDQLYLKASVRLFGDRKFSSDLLSFDERLTERLSLRHKMPIYVYHENVLSLDAKNVMSCAKIGPKTAPKDTTSISICDNYDVINRKLKKAFFDPKTLENDPTLDIVEKIIWPQLNEASFKVKRTADNGGDVDFNSLDEVKAQLVGDLMHPGDVKVAASIYLSTLFLDPICSQFSTDKSSLITSAFPEDIKHRKVNKKAFNPNKIDFRVAVVTSVIFIRGHYNVTFKCGFDSFSFVKTVSHNLTPNDCCVVVVNECGLDKALSIVGILTNVAGQSLNVKRKSYVNAVSFKGHQVFVPHLRDADLEVIVTQINNNVIVKDGRLLWNCDGSIMKDIELNVDSCTNTKVCISLF